MVKDGDAAESGRYAIQVTRASTLDLPARKDVFEDDRCLLVQGFPEVDGKMLILHGRILSPEMREGRPYEIPFKVRFFRYGTGKVYANVSFAE